MDAKFGKFDNARFAPFAERADLVASGGVATGPLIHGETRPLLLSLQRLEPGASLEWRSPAQDHLIYVLAGSAEADGAPIGETQVLIIEHGAHAVVRAGSAGAELLHFERRADYGKRPDKAGGAAHLAPLRLGKPIGPGPSRHSVYADGECPGCDVWLHLSEYPGEYTASRHFHTADEIIVAIEGGLKLGPITHRRTAVAIDANAPYQFSTAPEGLRFLNFRAEHSLYKRIDLPEPQEFLDEGEYIRALLEETPAHAS